MHALTGHAHWVIPVLVFAGIFTSAMLPAAEPPPYDTRITDPDTERYYTYAAPDGPGYGVAQFVYWQPAEVDKIEGVMVCLAGIDADGRPNARDFRWQAFAANHHFGLLGCFFQNAPQDAANRSRYTHVSEGSGQALLDALAYFAKETNRPEVADAHLMFWGFSAGGMYAYSFASWKPERTIGFVMNKAGGDTEPAPFATRRVPGILFVGENDDARRNEGLDTIFRLNRNLGAPWAIARQPGVGHDEADSKELAFRYFDAIIPLRLSQGCASLRELDQSEGWLGDPRALTVRPARMNAESDALTVWLPDERTARHWQLHVSGKVEEIHLP